MRGCELGVEELYRQRFDGMREKRNRVWRVLCKYFEKYIPDNATVLDIACGYGEFVNNLQIPGAVIFAADINPDSEGALREGIKFIQSSAELVPLPDASVDVVIASNFFEHLPNSEMFLAVLRNINRMLKPGGRLLVLQPDLRLTGAAFWDFLDHRFPVTVPRMIEAARLVGLAPERVINRFLPYTMNCCIPTYPMLVSLYLALMPISGWLLGKQAFVVFKKKEAL